MQAAQAKLASDEDKLEIERLPVDAGQSFAFDRILLVNNDGKVTVGATSTGCVVTFGTYGLNSGNGFPRSAVYCTVTDMTRTAALRVQQSGLQNFTVVGLTGGDPDLFSITSARKSMMRSNTHTKDRIKMMTPPA